MSAAWLAAAEVAAASLCIIAWSHFVSDAGAGTVMQAHGSCFRMYTGLCYKTSTYWSWTAAQPASSAGALATASICTINCASGKNVSGFQSC
jgi:hypothetical protein